MAAKTNDIIKLGLQSDERIVRLAATKAAEQRQDYSLLPILEKVIEDPKSDRYLAFSAWMGIDETDEELGKAALKKYTDLAGRMQGATQKNAN